MAIRKNSFTMTPKTGVYPGSGVAPGGQQGRSRSIHNGVTGTTSSNRSPAASQRRGMITKGGGRPVKPGAWKPAPKPTITKPKPINTRPSEFGGFTKPKPKPPSAPVIEDFGRYKDSQYWLDLNDLRNQLGLIQNPDGSLVNQSIQSRLAQLGQRIDPSTMRPVAPGSVGGKTLYDILYEQQRRSDAKSIAMARSEAARRGIIRSGYNDRQLSDIGAQSVSAIDRLVREYGTDLNDLRSAAYAASQQQASALQQYQQSQANIAAAAAQRGYEQELNRYRASVGGYQ